MLILLNFPSINATGLFKIKLPVLHQMLDKWKVLHYNFQKKKKMTPAGPVDPLGDGEGDFGG